MQLSYTKDRQLSDSAGIIPMAIGGICSPPLQGRGLYFDRPLTKYTPPQVNLKTGQYTSRVAATAAVVKDALKTCKIELIDLIRSVKGTPSYTPMAKILGEFKKYEESLLKFVVDNKTVISSNNTAISAMILKNLRKSAHAASVDTNGSKDLKHVIQGLVKQGKKMTEDALERTLLISESDLSNENFSGQDNFDVFYKTYIFDMEANKLADESSLKTFREAKKAMEDNSITACSHVVTAFHVYYDAFLNGTELDANTEKTIDVTWRDAAFPPKPSPVSLSAMSVNNSSHQAKANSIVDGVIWNILLERFEIFASIVDYVFNVIAGPGSEITEHSVDMCVRMGIISAMTPSFQTKSSDSLDVIAGTNYVDVVGKLVRQVVLVHRSFSAWITSGLLKNWLTSLETHTAEEVAKMSEEEKAKYESERETVSMDEDTLTENISSDLYSPSLLKEKTIGGTFSKLSLKFSKVRNLSIRSTTKLLSLSVKSTYDTLASDVSLFTSNKGKSSITHFKPSTECDRIRDLIFRGMVAKLQCPRTVREVFAAKVITTLYNQDAHFVALFLLKHEESTGRAALAVNVLKKVGSVFKVAGDVTLPATDLKIASVLNVTPLADVHASASKSAAQGLLLADADGWSTLYKLSPEIKIANDRALIQAANTNKTPEPKKVAAPPQPNPPKKDRPKSAPPPANNKSKGGPQKGGPQKGRPQKGGTRKRGTQKGGQ